MPELKALVREHGLRSYSRLRKADLIVLLQDNERRTQSRQQSAPTGPTRRRPKVSELRLGPSGAPEPYQGNVQGLTKRQLKHR